MATSLSKFIRAPVDEVFAFFDDPWNTLQVNPHAVSYEVADTQPDGRRTIDIVMRAGTREWMQTMNRSSRESPTRVVTRGAHGPPTGTGGSWSFARTGVSRQSVTEPASTSPSRQRWIIRSAGHS